MSSKLSIGIVGLPNVGKSTLFNALTKNTVDMANYPFCTIDPSVGVVGVPDERLEKLHEFSQSEKKVPAVIEFVDIAGLVKGAHKGEGLGNKFLANIREVSAIAHVIRIFESDKIIHVSGTIDPLRDVEEINIELTLADLQVVNSRLGAIERDIKRGEKSALLEKAVLEKLLKRLEVGEAVNSLSFEKSEIELVKSLHLLTLKPTLYVLNKSATSKNLDDASVRAVDDRYDKLLNFLNAQGAYIAIIDANIEHEIMDMSTEERDMFREELGNINDGTTDLIKTGYALLNLITFFTTGKDETRAWTIKNGDSAPMAGTAIHTDFRDKFIRADIIYWADLLKCGSYARARETGRIRTEGKEYIVKDGDVIEFKI